MACTVIDTSVIPLIYSCLRNVQSKNREYIIKLQYFMITSIRHFFHAQKNDFEKVIKHAHRVEWGCNVDVNTRKGILRAS